MRFAWFCTLILPCLLACSDSSSNTEVEQEMPFLSYESEPQPRGGLCTNTVDVSAPLIVSGFGFNHSNTRNQASLIDSTNVGALAINYIYAPANSTEKRGAPAATAQAFFMTSGSELIAINRLSGCRYWSFTNSDKGANFRSGSILFVPASEASTAVVYAADSSGYVYAVNAVSGEALWHRFVGTNPRYHFITGGMQHYQGKLFVPVSSNELLNNLFSQEACCSTHGMLVALEAATGDTVWEYHTTEDANEIVVADNRVGPNGAAVWSAPTVDAGRNAIYIGTGQNYTEPVTITSDAIISLDMDSGDVNWVFQARETDAWNANCIFPDSMRCPDPEGHDFDFGAAPILLEDGDTLIAGDKGGVVYSIQAETGKLNWSNKVSIGSTLGGIHFGMAVDRQRVYVAATDFNVDKATGGLAELVPGAKPGIYALSLDRGAIEWEVHPAHIYEGLTTPSIYSASLSVSNDVLFAGSLDGVVRAFDTNDGAEKWSLDTAVSFTDINGVTGNGGTIDSVGVVVSGDGLLINSGYATFQAFDGRRYQAGPGNALFVLSLPPGQ
jgi:polyvinyl alcohol dehydrogenase (cytochrome)